MAMTLTQAAGMTKKAVVIGFITLVVGIFLMIAYNVSYNYYQSTRPQAADIPNMKFGILPAFLPNTKVSSASFTYSLDTATGGFPQTPKLLPVYFIPHTGVSLLAPDKYKELATTLGFPLGPEVLSPTQSKFTDGGGGQLIIDLATGNFQFTRTGKPESGTPAFNPYNNRPQVLGNSEAIAGDFRSYLGSKKILNEALQKGKSNVVYSGSSPADSQTADVSIWPEDIDKFPIVTANYSHGLVRATVTKAGDELSKFIKINYIFWQIDKNVFSTYPLITAAEAFDELQKGNSYVSYSPNEAFKISVSTIKVGYFESETYTPYLQPVFVFEGPGFAALVPAVKQGNAATN